MQRQLEELTTLVRITAGRTSETIVSEPHSPQPTAAHQPRQLQETLQATVQSASQQLVEEVRPPETCVPPDEEECATEKQEDRTVYIDGVPRIMWSASPESSSCGDESSCEDIGSDHDSEDAKP
eukprot:3281004-Amphidinium_carterae.1